MTVERADLAFGAALGNLEEFSPKPGTAPEADTEEAAGFKSREAGAHQGTRRVRGRLTGRNAHFNLKVRPETIEEFGRIADDKGWGLGETRERGVALL